MVEPSYRGVTVDSEYTPVSNLLQHVEGASWSCNYYAQVLNADNELTPQALDRAAPYQQYWLIEQMELKVTGALVVEQDPEGKSMKATGEATIYPGTGLIPNKYDMFLADIGDGREGLFVVMDSTKKNYLNQSCYVIQYELKGYSEDSSLADLDRKTVKTTRFVKEFLTYGQNPQVLSEDYVQLLDFNKRYRELVSLYLRDFFSIEEQTLLVPGQSLPTYDPFITKAFLSWVSTSDHPYVMKIRLPNVDGDKVMALPTLWDCLNEMNHDLLPTAMQSVSLVDSGHWSGSGFLGGVYFSGILRVVYPSDPRTDVDEAYDQQCTASLGQVMRTGGNRYSDLVRLTPSPYLNGLTYQHDQLPSIPDIVPVTYDTYYVFSQAFYQNTAPLKSNLERLVLAALKGEAMDKTILSRLSQSAMTWENLERFYYIPVLLALLKVASRTN